MSDNCEINIKCSKVARDSLLEMLSYLKWCGDAGHSISFMLDGREFTVSADGSYKISYFASEEK